MNDDANKLCSTCVYWKPNATNEPSEGEFNLCYHLQVNLDVRASHTCSRHLAATSTLMNVPNHTPQGTMISNPNPNLVDGPVEVFIVSYWKDFQWLEYTLKSIRRRFTGFQGITVAHPHRDRELFRSLTDRFGVRLHGYHEVDGKGMVQHMVKMAEADLIVPPGTKYVLHTDSDGIFHIDSRPENFFAQGKPQWLIRTWSSIEVHDPTNPLSKPVPNCRQWKGPTDRQLGWDTEWYAMCLFNQVLPIDFYAPYRDYITRVQGKPFDEYMMEGKNSFPQTVMDWTAMGAWAHKYMRDRFTWFDVASGQYPPDRLKAFWSHGGITEVIRKQIGELLK